MGAGLKSDLEFGSWNQTKNALIRVKSWMSGIKICKSNPYIVMLSKVKISEIIWLSGPRLPRFLSNFSVNKIIFLCTVDSFGQFP